jgi:hypothetical protein
VSGRSRLNLVFKVGYQKLLELEIFWSVFLKIVAIIALPLWILFEVEKVDHEVLFDGWTLCYHEALMVYHAFDLKTFLIGVVKLIFIVLMYNFHLKTVRNK